MGTIPSVASMAVPFATICFRATVGSSFYADRSRSKEHVQLDQQVQYEQGVSRLLILHLPISLHMKFCTLTCITFKAGGGASKHCMQTFPAIVGAAYLLMEQHEYALLD